jgi:hypothetical protein
MFVNNLHLNPKQENEMLDTERLARLTAVRVGNQGRDEYKHSALEARVAALENAMATAIDALEILHFELARVSRGKKT